MTTKTPEQIADEFYDRYIEESANGGYPMWRQTIQDAIEADRSQRADALDALHEWAVNVSGFMAEDKSNDWSEEIGALVEIEQMYELVNKAGEGN